MTGEEIREKLQANIEKLARLESEVDEARSELRKAQLSYSELNSPAAKARAKGAQANLQMLAGTVELAEGEVETLRAQLAETTAQEEHEAKFELLTAMAINANQRLGEYLAAREAAEISRRHHEKATRKAFFQLNEIRREFALVAGHAMHLVPGRFGVPGSGSARDKDPASVALYARREAQAEKQQELKHELETRVGSLEGLINYYGLTSEVELPISELANLPEIPEDELPEPTDEPEEAESEVVLVG